MRYSQLPSKLKELVKERCQEQNKMDIYEHCILEDDSVSGFFTWANTKEGYSFWEMINIGKIPKEYKNTNDIIENFEFC